MLEMANHRAKLSKIWDSGILVDHIWDNFDLIMFMVMLGSFSVFAAFPKILFLHHCFR